MPALGEILAPAFAHMATVRVTALKAFTHRGQAVSKGELVSMDAVDASVAGRRGEVSLDRGVNARSLKAETSEAHETAPRRRYRRRDMRADE